MSIKKCGDYLFLQPEELNSKNYHKMTLTEDHRQSETGETSLELIVTLVSCRMCNQEFPTIDFDSAANESKCCTNCREEVKEKRMLLAHRRIEKMKLLTHCCNCQKEYSSEHFNGKLSNVCDSCSRKQKTTNELNQRKQEYSQLFSTYCNVCLQEITVTSSLANKKRKNSCTNCGEIRMPLSDITNRKQLDTRLIPCMSCLRDLTERSFQVLKHGVRLQTCFECVSKFKMANKFREEKTGTVCMGCSRSLKSNKFMGNVKVCISCTHKLKVNQANRSLMKYK